MLKVLVLGGTGMLGHRLAITLAQNHTVAITTRKPILLKRLINKFKDMSIKVYSNIEATNINQVEKTICMFKPDIVLNCIGIIKQLNESKRHIIALDINSLFPHKLAELSIKYRYRLILFSTDCVFDGEKGDYTESDKPDTTDLYGKSKLLGEVGSQENVLTIRTSIVGRELEGQKSLLDWFLRSEDIQGYKYAIFSGLPTYSLSKIIDKFIIPQTNLYGVVHIASKPISKLHFLEQVNTHYGLNKSISEEMTVKIDRSLNCDFFCKSSGYEPLSWDVLIPDLLVNDSLYINSKIPLK